MVCGDNGFGPTLNSETNTGFNESLRSTFYPFLSLEFWICIIQEVRSRQNQMDLRNFLLK